MFLKSTAFILALAAALTSAAPSPIVTSNSVGNSELALRADHKGLGTVFTQSGTTGSCQHKNPDSAHIVALSNFFMKSQSPSPNCGRKIQILNTGSNDGVGGKGKTVTVTVADTCPECDENHLDMSVGAWNQLTGNAPFGTVDISW